MKCEVCRIKNAAFYRYVAALGKKVPVCAACFQSSFAFSKNNLSEIHPSHGLEELVKDLMNFQPVYEYYSESEGIKNRGAVCPNCGFEFEEYYEKGRLGCVKCYDVFRAQIMPVVHKIHGSVRHNGSRPNLAGSLRKEQPFE